jgi:long-chain acyl-CoA synthetase
MSPPKSKLRSAATPAVATDDSAARAARGAGRAIARLAKHLEHGLAPVDLSVPQYRVLALLAGGPAASSWLADRLTVSPPSVTAVVDGLVARALVVRNPDPSDRRRLNLELTEAGRRLLVAADDSVNERLAQIAAHLAGSAPERKAGTDPSDAVRDLEEWHDALDAYREERQREAKAGQSPQ